MDEEEYQNTNNSYSKLVMNTKSKSGPTAKPKISMNSIQNIEKSNKLRKMTTLYTLENNDNKVEHVREVNIQEDL